MNYPKLFPMNKLWLSLIFLLTISPGIAQFQEVSVEKGIDHLSFSNGFMGGGAVFLDYNNDGFEDLYITGGQSPDKLYQNFGDGTFFDVSNQSQVTRYTETYYTSAVASGDIDNDGCEDIFITSFIKSQRNILLRNNCDGTFTNIGWSAGIRETSESTGAAFFDYNKDGFLDIYVLNYIEEFNFILDEDNEIIGVEGTCLPNYFYINNGDLTFKEAANFMEIDDSGCGLAIQPTDLDFDGDQDLYVGNDHGQYVVHNGFYQNEFPANDFTETSNARGLDAQIYSMGIASGDYDEDGYLDYYVSNLGDNLLFRNNGNHVFDETAKSLGVENGFHSDSISIISWGTFFFDPDNDTDLDLFVSNGYLSTGFFVYVLPEDTNRFYLNHGDGSFSDQTEVMGLLNDEKNRGAVYSDYDQDGDLDFIVVNNSNDSTDRSSFYENLNSNGNSWIQLKLEGTSPVNLNAFGSFARAYKDGRMFIRELYSGGSYASQHSQLLHWGLGTYPGLDSLIITWPDQSISSFYDIEANHIYYSKMGTETLEILGCTDINSPNFDPEATFNSGCLIDKISGCTDPEANNYDDSANFNDGSCDYSDEIVTGLDDLQRAFKVYPNPFRDHLILNAPLVNQNSVLRLMDLTGREVWKQSFQIKNKIRYNTPDLKEGIYFLVITNENEEVLYSSKVIKRN